MTFHLYGFIVGCAACAVIIGLEKMATESAPQKRLPLSNLQLVALLIVMLVGARAWHLLMREQPLTAYDIFAVWQGGLSILGAVAGMIMGIWWLVRDKKERWWLFDALGLWLPIGQAIGRLANWWNQELYGLPTEVPWKITIDQAHRLPGFEAFAYYHPLFAYEMVGVLVIAAILWLWKISNPKVMGSGLVAAWYACMYSWLRFGLDFYRIDREMLWAGVLGKNQLILAIIGSVMLGWLIGRALYQRVSKKWGWTIGILLGTMLLAISISVGQFIHRQLFNSSLLRQFTSVSAVQQSSAELRSVPDHAIAHLTIGSEKLLVEVVNSQASRTLGLSGRTKIGEDGMLFIFPYADRWVFWMKDMKFGLDIVWLNQGKIVDIVSDVPPPAKNALLEDLPKYAPQAPADLVLEVPMGMAAKLGWKIGDQFTIAVP